MEIAYALERAFGIEEFDLARLSVGHYSRFPRRIWSIVTLCFIVSSSSRELSTLNHNNKSDALE